MTSCPRPDRLRRPRAFTAIFFLLAGCAIPVRSLAEEVMQGVLQLRWGDGPPVATGKTSPHTPFEVWLDAGPGGRHRLDADEARRAAGDLYALANRRVAVSYAARTGLAPLPIKGRVAKAAMVVDAIVPAEPLPARALVVGMEGRSVLAASVQGNTRWITLMCKFADVAAEQKSRDFFQSQYGSAPGQLGHFWSDVSYGNINLAESTAHGWYTLPKPRAGYVDTVDNKPRADLSLLFADCTAMADAEVDFRGIQGINLMFNGELDGYAWGGGACASLDGVYACPRSTWNPPWSFTHLASLAHEMGHGYGLPHSNNSDGDGDTFDNPWDLMSDAWRMADSDAVYGLLPKHINMYQRQRLGWVTAARTLIIPPEDIDTREIVLDAAGLHDARGVQLLVLALPAQPDPFATVLYTVEARRRSGSYESRLAGDAVIIHRVNDYGIAYSMDTDVPPATHSSNEGSMLKPGERWNMPEGGHWVEVVSETANGFRVRVGPRPRVMGSPLPALVRSNSFASERVPQERKARIGAPGVLRATPSRGSADPRHRHEISTPQSRPKDVRFSPIADMVVEMFCLQSRIR